MTRREFLAVWLRVVMALMLPPVKIAHASEPTGQMPMNVPYTIADRQKKRIFIPAVMR